MDFSIFDNSVSNTMNVFLVIGNIINFVYNLPQMVKTYKTKSTRDFSSTFLFLRVVGNTIWLVYSIEIKSFLFLLCNVVSVGASVFISYYKVIEIYKDYKNKKNGIIDPNAIGPNAIGPNAIDPNAIGPNEIGTLYSMV